MDFALPEIGEGVYEAELVSWLVNVGDAVKPGQNLLEVLTDKATMEVPAPFAGTVTALRAKPGQPIKVGEVILSYTPVSQPVAAAARPPAEPTPAALPAPPAPRAGQNGPAPVAAPGRLPVKASPSVRHLARQLGIDLAAIRGTGPQGRILLDDLGAQPRHAGENGGRARAAEARPDYGTPGTRIKLQGLRRRIAEHMALATRTIPHYSYVDECDVTELVRLRESLRENFASAGVKLTYLAFVVKAVAEALKEVPLVNASLDEAAGEIVLHDRYDVGIAVATPAGLIVPVVRDADRKDLAVVAREIDRLSGAARAGKARLEDLRGGTFTVTSVGNIGGLFSTPVINHPEAAILGVGKVVKRPVFDAAGQVRPADMVYLSLSFDHRLIDGAVGAAFANAVIRRLQSPAALLLPAQL
jgi:pyruvate dehydrogenase E2 component (dihydrolipoamide acetyltransferase)/2-oxoisovalerate dehydrogenase E2 component (dihydrolipoyl transacylase)